MWRPKEEITGPGNGSGVNRVEVWRCAAMTGPTGLAVQPSAKMTGPHCVAPVALP